MPTSLELQSSKAVQFIQECWDQAAERTSRISERAYREIILCGCGDSHHAAYSTAHVLESWTGMRSFAYPSLEAARYSIPRAAGESLLVIGISASGETARTIEALRIARQAGAQTLAITCDRASTLSSNSHQTISIDLPDIPQGPGLLSYLGALLAGYALAAEFADRQVRDRVTRTIATLPGALPDWLDEEFEKGRMIAQRMPPQQPILFLGAGPLRGSAMFAAAKAIEAVGQPSTSQDVEEWAHLEYFTEPAQTPVWMLSANGRSSMREEEVESAARRIGRDLIRSNWKFGSDDLREELGPLGLWAGPVAFADAMMKISGEQPFRGFGGGRHPEEGGGISRIRSSEQIASLKELERFNPLN